MKRPAFALLFCLLMSASMLCRAQKPELVVQTGHSSTIFSVAFSPDGQTLASGSSDSTIKLWNAARGMQLRTLTGPSDMIYCLAFSPDGQTLASGGYNGIITLWASATGKQLNAFKDHSNPAKAVAFNSVKAVAFSPDGQTLASGGYGETITLWDIASGTERGTLTGHSKMVTSLAFSPNGRMLVSGSSDSTLKVWDVSGETEARTLRGHKGGVNSVAFSPDGKTLASGSDDNTIKIWDAITGVERRTLRGHSLYVTCLAFSPDGLTLASGSGDQTVNLWNVADGRQRHVFKGHTGSVEAVAISPDGSTLASGSFDQTVKLWDVKGGMERYTLKGHSGYVGSVAYSPDGKTFASSSGDKTIKLWDVTTDTNLRSLSGHSEETDCLAFSPDGNTLASGSFDKMVELWDVKSGVERHTLKGHSDTVTCLAFSPDGKILASGSGDCTINLWDPATSHLIHALIGHTNAVKSVAFSPDGKILASGSADTTINFWDVATGQMLKTLTGNNNTVSSVAFSPDGKTFASGGWDQTVYLWNLAAGTPPRALRGHSDWISCVAFSGDGKTLASGSLDKSVKLWNVADGIELHSLSGHSAAVTSISFSPNGNALASSSNDRSIRFWTAQEGTELAALYSLDENDWAIADPQGRFDTDNLDNDSLLHWVLPDAPFMPLPLEAFMRQYYEPRLLPRLLSGEKLPPIPSIAALNRVQAQVHITEVKAHPDDPAVVDVTVEAKGATGTSHRNGQDVVQRSGVYDLRLFRNGQLVGYLPQGDEGEKLTDLTNGTNGSLTHTFTVRLAHDGAKSAEFSAYAFNADQVKSQTDRRTYKLLPSFAPVKGRVYVIAMGVNAYEDIHWNLHYAAKDAHLLLDTLPGEIDRAGQFREVVSVPLLSDYTVTAGGSTVLGDVSATRANLRAVFHTLAGEPTPADTVLLRTLPHADQLQKATPEDMVLLTFACHGDADNRGNFYLFPYDIGPTQEQGLTDDLRAHAVSSQDLSLWLRDVDAGTMAMIVDACHSAATVNVPGFKPGPMGSRGLGQLAYDKGMQILAASQTDNVALESDQLGKGHGLLTWALVHDGLNAAQADAAPKDGVITLSEWLRYGAARVPALYQEVQAGQVQSFGRDAPRGTEAVETAAERASDAALSVQQPSLFDFNKQKRDVRLAPVGK